MIDKFSSTRSMTLPMDSDVQRSRVSNLAAPLRGGMFLNVGHDRAQVLGLVKTGVG